MTYVLTGKNDLAMVGEIKPYVGQVVERVKVCKSGLIQVRTADGTLLSVPRSNLEPTMSLEECR